METIRLRRWSREEYDRLTRIGVFSPREKVDLIDGEILEVTPQGARHATAIRLAEDALRDVAPPGYDVRPQLPLALDDFSEPEPDVAVVAGSPRTYAEQHPTSAVLVVEIADKTLEFDRGTRASLYARAGIPEYWIVDLIDGRVEVYREPATSAGACSGWTYRQAMSYAGDQQISPLFSPHTTIRVSQLLP